MLLLANSGALLGRLLVGALFIPAGLSKIGGFEGTVGYIASVGLPLATVAAVVAIAVEVLGGAALLLGWRTKQAALISLCLRWLQRYCSTTFGLCPQNKRLCSNSCS